MAWGRTGGWRVFTKAAPHELLQGRGGTPGLDYPAPFQRRQIHPNGCMLWKGHDVYVSLALKNEPVGLEEASEGVWSATSGRS